MVVPANPNPSPFPIDGSPRVAKVSLARSLGRPFAEGTVETWLSRGRAYLAGAADMARLNNSWDLALAEQDVKLLELLLQQAEAIFDGGFYDVEAVNAAHREADQERGRIVVHTFDQLLDLQPDA